MQHGLIGKLLVYFKNLYLIHSQKDFIPILFLSESYSIHDTTMASIALYDFFPAGERDTLNTLFHKKEEQKKYIDSLSEFLSPLSSDQKVNLNIFLLQTIKETTNYGKKRKPIPDKADDWANYDEDMKNRLISYYNQKISDPKTTPYNVFLFICFSVDKKLPPFFTYGQKYLSDLEEFNENILCKYGVISEPGKRAIVELAFRKDGTGNIFALCEYGDMLYYGDSSLGSPNYAEAIRIYEVAAGVKKTKDMETVCHPLALFSLSYIFFNYHRRGKLKNISDIEYLERYTELERVEIAINYSKLSLSFLETGAAYNNLGVISETLSPDLLEKYKLKPAQFYYEKATTYDYVYAYNNLASLEAKLLDNDPEHEMLHLTRCLEYLSHSAADYEPWSANWLGNFYLSGKIRGSDKTYDELINRDLAKEYFFKALQYYIDRNSAWAAANLIVYFPEIYISDIELLYSHIDICLTKGDTGILTFLADMYDIDCIDFINQQHTKWESFCSSFRDSIIKRLSQLS